MAPISPDLPRRFRFPAASSPRYDRAMGVSLHYCHVCRRETAEKRYDYTWRWLVNWLSGWLMLVGSPPSLDSYERNRPLRCGVCGTTYSLIDAP